MGALSVRPSAGVAPRRAATAASELASGKKRPRVAPARDSAAATTRNNSVVTVTAGGGGELSSSQELLLQKRLATELDAMRGLLKKAELTSRRGTSKGGGAPTAGKKDRYLLVSNQRPKLIEEDFNAPSVKRSKVSTTLVVVAESKNEKVADDESKDDKITEESKGEVVVVRKQEAEEYADISGGLSFCSSGDSGRKVVQQSSEAKKKEVQDAQQRAAPKAVVVDMAGLLYRANLRRRQLEMERAIAR